MSPLSTPRPPKARPPDIEAPEPLAARTDRVEPVDPIDFLEAHEGQPRFLYWRRGKGVAAAGISAEARAAGPDRFDRLLAAAERTTSVIIHERMPTVPPDAGPAWLGGFSFSDEGGADPAWPSARFVLASRQLRATEEGVFLTTVGTLATGAPEPEPRRPAASPWKETPDFHGWELMVRAALAAIANRSVEKVVLARTISRRLGPRFRLTSFLRAVARSAPDARLFLFEPRPGHALVCASPELLVRRSRDELEAEAMAGSRPRGLTASQDDALARQLLGSPKDLREHEIVVRYVQTALSQLGYMWEILQDRHVVKLPNVQHLETRFRAEGASKDHVLALAKALHPTPAVAGWPREPALSLLSRLEPAARGWYAGPVGWFDRAGDGEFAVALRSALIREGEATLHAGCGILRGSLPLSEWQEAEAKFRHIRVLLDADVGA